jgi:D-3-phosphoglycerate dehydrogenase / 2-oxoglutarate reductase
VRVLVVGDSFMPVAVFRAGLEHLRPLHELDYLQLDERERLVPQTGSERAIREYAGHPAEVAEAVAGHEALVVHGAPVTAEVLDAAPGLRLVACARGGPVNVDVAAASERRIAVVTTPGKNAEAVAELVIAFMLALARRLPAAERAAARGGTGESTFEGAEFLGRELAGRSLGLVGFGHVGRQVAPRARALGMRVRAYDPFAPPDDPEVEPVEDLRALLASSDVVSLHARAGAGNENLFSHAEFAAMRPGALFINTARETLVDEAALLAALDRLGGAALDVVRGDREIAGENVIVTPHIGGATEETLARGVRMVARELERLALGEPLHNLANPEAAAA